MSSVPPVKTARLDMIHELQRHDGGESSPTCAECNQKVDAFVAALASRPAGEPPVLRDVRGMAAYYAYHLHHDKAEWDWNLATEENRERWRKVADAVPRVSAGESCIHCGERMGVNDDACFSCYSIALQRAELAEEQLAAGAAPDGRAPSEEAIDAAADVLRFHDHWGMSPEDREAWIVAEQMLRAGDRRTP